VNLHIFAEADKPMGQHFVNSSVKLLALFPGLNLKATKQGTRQEVSDAEIEAIRGLSREDVEGLIQRAGSTSSQPGPPVTEPTTCLKCIVRPDPPVPWDKPLSE